MFCLWGYPGLAFHMCFANAPLPFEAATGQWLGKSWGWVVVSVWCMMFLFVWVEWQQGGEEFGTNHMEWASGFDS